jgi:hypothetical protein
VERIGLLLISRLWTNGLVFALPVDPCSVWHDCVYSCTGSKGFGVRDDLASKSIQNVRGLHDQLTGFCKHSLSIVQSVA